MLASIRVGRNRAGACKKLVKFYKKMMIYSHSRLETFEKCRMKFKFRYIDKITPEIGQSIEAHLGKMVHETFEWLYNQTIKKIIPSIEQVISYYSNKWQEQYTNDIIIVKRELSEKDYFNKGVEFLVKYYTKHYPFKEKTIALEHKIEVNLTNEIKLIGFIDRLVENLETNEIEIHDYKTSNSMPSREKIENDRQLALYSIAIKERLGKDKNICLVWHYLAHDIKICVRKTEQQLENLKQEIISLIKQIEEAQEFPPTKSILCDWCEYRDICPAWGGQPNNKERQITFNDLKENLDIWD